MKLRLLLLLVAGVLAGCGGDDDGGGGGDSAGAQVFEEQDCGRCHTFTPAGSTGTIGPNLDESTIDTQAAIQQIREGGGGMPAFIDKLTFQQIEDVATYVTQGREPE
jgi:mono/diheme cytochrome c family protein